MSHPISLSNTYETEPTSKNGFEEGPIEASYFEKKDSSQDRDLNIVKMEPEDLEPPSPQSTVLSRNSLAERDLSHTPEVSLPCSVFIKTEVMEDCIEALKMTERSKPVSYHSYEHTGIDECLIETPSKEECSPQDIASKMDPLECHLPSSSLSDGESEEEVNVNPEEAMALCSTSLQEVESFSKSGDKRTLSCPHCPFTTSYKTSFKVHVRTHTGEKPHKCSQCSFSCSRKNAFDSHLRIHTGEKPFECSQCSYSSSCRGDLTKHLITHTGEKPYSCPQCPYSCSRKRSLAIHMRTHTGEKPYKCPQCVFRCADKSKLSRHNRIHTGVKPHKCPRCSFACSDKNSLHRHMGTHTGEILYQCPQCYFSSSDKIGLDRHVKTHREDKIFKCPQCLYHTFNKCNFDRHVRTHTGEKPFECPLCPFTCAQKRYLIRHSRTHSDKKSDKTS